MKYSFTINLETKTQHEAELKVKSLTVLASRLTALELERLAHIVKNDPVKTALAKQYLM
ncbi:MAG TPA: hypothetical protein VM802_10190 [Chitinophaga sp.]|uniref:hypothetical protein n=1 Tax=Chitinophaga sp. TaxID=1869181 RepID=UPI002C26638F|nr:hypothetical protein [Chitinophaga sp.]HVI45232.1 hypothetical protein [Chitinophaga sp.]